LKIYIDKTVLQHFCGQNLHLIFFANGVIYLLIGFFSNLLFVYQTSVLSLNWRVRATETLSAGSLTAKTLPASPSGMEAAKEMRTTSVLRRLATSSASLKLLREV